MKLAKSAIKSAVADVATSSRYTVFNKPDAITGRRRAVAKTSAAETNSPMSPVGRVNIIDHPNVHYVVQGITQRLAELEIQARVYTAKQAAAGMRDCEVLLTCGAYSCTAEAIDSMPSLMGIAALAAGTESIDIPAATQRGLVVAHSPTPQNVTSMAEASVMVILASLYRLLETESRFRQGWNRPNTPYARTLSGKTVGLIGFGKIARAVAHRLCNWDVRIITYSPRANLSELPAYVHSVNLEALLRESDVVSLHAGLHDGNRGLVNEWFLQHVKPGAVLVNTARGGLIDEEALLRYAQEGKPAYVALDCFQQEPLPADSALRELPDALMTPHMVGHTLEVQDSLVEQGVHNVLDILARRQPTYVRNPEVLERWTTSDEPAE